jgi:GT2 family glycosyltransferase
MTASPWQLPRSPTVSVVLATYNRPDVLAAAIRSVLAQEFEDWELIVVGDQCAEATGKTVSGFGDPRIRYINLAVNYGEQSGPNNVGIARARGRYLAFLSHDDLWFPDHLRGAVDWLEASGADIVIARAASVMPAESHPAKSGDWWVRLRGLGRRGSYDPLLTVGPASCLLLKAETAARVGPWRPAIECYLSSSQEWLFRAWKRGAIVRTWPHLTVLIMASGDRPGSYLLGDSPEHAYFEPLLKTPAKLRRFLLDPCRIVEPHSVWRRGAEYCLTPFLRSAAWLGIAPSELLGRLRYGFERGAFINRLRKIRGLGPLATREDPSPSQLRARYLRPEAPPEEQKPVAEDRSLPRL